MGILIASSPSSPRQVLSRFVRPAAVSKSRVSKSSLTVQSVDVVAPPIGLRKRCVPVASVASPVASALHTPKSALRGVFQNLKRAVWREKSTRLARLLPQSRLHHPQLKLAALEPRHEFKAFCLSRRVCKPGLS